MHIQADSAPNCLLRPRHLFPPPVHPPPGPLHPDHTGAQGCDLRGWLGSDLRTSQAQGLVDGNDGNRSWTQREYPHALEAMDTGRIGFNFTPGDARRRCSGARLGAGPASGTLSMRRDAVVRRCPADTARIAAIGTALIGQIQRMNQAAEAMEEGTAVIVAQGAEAARAQHGFTQRPCPPTFVPEVADWFSANVPETL